MMTLPLSSKRSTNDLGVRSFMRIVSNNLRSIHGAYSSSRMRQPAAHLRPLCVRYIHRLDVSCALHSCLRRCVTISLKTSWLFILVLLFDLGSRHVVFNGRTGWSSIFDGTSDTLQNCFQLFGGRIAGC